MYLYYITTLFNKYMSHINNTLLFIFYLFFNTLIHIFKQFFIFLKIRTVIEISAKDDTLVSSTPTQSHNLTSILTNTDIPHRPW
jgi:hypothetical protein